MKCLQKSSGFALVSTLLVLTLLTIMVIAFMQSMRIDRLTARAYINKAKADMMADAALHDAVHKIIGSIPQGADSEKGFITWAYSSNNGFSPFYVGISPDVLDGDASTNTVWLVSSQNAADSTTHPPTAAHNLGPNDIMALSSAQSVDMNKDGIIDPSGTRYPAGWIDVQSGQSANPGSFTGRYAFWVDDESSKLDLGRVGNADNTVKNPSSTYSPTTSQPTDPNAPLDGTNLKVEGLSSDDMKTLAAFRQKTIWPTAKSAPQTLSKLSAPTSQSGLYTVDANHYYNAQTNNNLQDPQDLIAYGPKVGETKLNINTLVNSNSTQPENAVSQISQHIQDALPNYYARKNSPDGTVNRIAASIVNYIRPEKWPILSPTLQSSFSNIPALANAWPSYTNTSAWYGIAAVPRVNEILAYYVDGSSASPQWSNIDAGGGKRKYQAGMTRIIELWNQSNASITLPNLYIHLFRQQSFSIGFTTVPLLQGAEDIELSSGNITLQANEFHAFYINSIYSFESTTNTSYSKSTIGAANNCGYVLFYVDGTSPTFVQSFDNAPFNPSTIAATINGTTVKDGTISVMGGTARVLDGFSGYNLQAAPASSQAGTSPGYSNSGNSADARMNLGLFLPQWATNTNSAHTPGSANNTTFQSRKFQDMTTWFDEPRIGGTLGVSPLTGPVHVAHAPMQNIIELGNIFDPGNDTQTNDGKPRGTKTLAVGQFDSFVHGTYSDYLQKADTALLDILSIDDNNDHYRLNINVPRPGTLAPPATYTTINPLQTFWSFLRNQDLTTAPTGTTTPHTADNPINPHIISRLVASDWKSAMPFRNFNDFTLLGYTPTQLTGTLADNISVWGRNAPSNSIYSTSPSNINVNANTLGQSGSTSRLDGGDQIREEAFGRIAHLITFRSYRYRVYIQGQVLDVKSHVVARCSKSYLVELSPNLQTSAAQPNQLTYTVQITPQS